MDQQNNNYSPAPTPQPVQQQVPQSQPQYMQPPVQQYAQPAGYTGGQKAAWLFIGLLTGVAGILLGNVVNVDNPVRRSEAMKFAACPLLHPPRLGLRCSGCFLPQSKRLLSMT